MLPQECRGLRQHLPRPTQQRGRGSTRDALRAYAIA